MVSNATGGKRPNSQYTKQASSAKKQAPVKEALSDRKIEWVQKAQVAAAVFLGLTQSGVAKATGAFIGTLFEHPQAEGWIDSFFFIGPYVCLAGVYILLSFMKTK